MWQSKREISWECSDIIGSAKGSQISEKYWGKVGKGKRADVYLEVRKRRGHIFFEWNKCLWQKWIKSKINKYKINNDNKKQIQNMNLMLNMKDINKILAKVHFKCKYKQEKIWIIIPLSVFINMICAWSWISLQTRKTSVLLFIHSFLAHLAKGHVSFCHHVSSVVSPSSSSVVSFSHFNLLLRNHWVNLDQTLVEWSLDGPLPKLCPVIPTSNQYMAAKK